MQPICGRKIVLCGYILYPQRTWMARMMGMAMIGALAVPDAAALVSVRGTTAGHRRFPCGSWAVRKMDLHPCH